MLQINTGKLFRRDIGRTNALRGVLYTNLKLPWQRDIVTRAGTLRSTDTGRGNNAIVYEIEERIEQDEDGPGVLVSHTISPFIQDFSAVASFAFNAIVSPDPDLTLRLASGQAGLSSYDSPPKFVRRYFDKEIWLQDVDIEEFVSFVDLLLALDRKTFLGAMRAIKTFVSGMHRISDDLGLAYTLMVSAVESLAQDFDGYDSSWVDVDERKRKPIDEALSESTSMVAKQIRDAIVAVEHTSLGRRYREFAQKYVDTSYFRSGDALIGRPLAQYELAEALRQAYDIRSRYVHNLQVLPDGLTLPHEHWETTYIERKPTLTLQGLSRLTRHIIQAFVTANPTVEHEIYNYKLEEAGVCSIQLAPQYWVGNPFSKSQDARKRLEGFLEQLIAVMIGTSDTVLTDLRPMLKDVEHILPSVPKKDRPALVVLHGMFNAVVGPDQRTQGHDEFLERYKYEVTAPSSEALIALTLLNSETGWSPEIHRDVHDEYLKKRSKPAGLHAPRLVDAAISLVLAERYRIVGKVDVAIELIAIAVGNYPAQNLLYELENDFDKGIVIDWRKTLLPKANACV